uniref:Cilia- and flagella-associated protein 263 n=1 Tax=Spodoptera frugiperda TaxID=7108 RepID=A0A2H1WHX7_SPOFR
MHYSSIASGSESITDYPVDLLSDEELVHHVEHLRKQIRILKLENEVLEMNIMRLDPSLMVGVQEAFKYATKLPTASDENLGSFLKSQMTKMKLNENLHAVSGTTRSLRRADSRAKVNASTVTRVAAKINVNERHELLSIAIQHVEKNIHEWKKKCKTKTALFNAQLEACELWIIDTEKSAQSFNEEVIVKGYDRLTQRIPAEVWIRFMIEWSKSTDKKLDKLRLKNSTLNTQYKKIKATIGAKRELSKNLTPVDFDKKRIQNQEAEKLLEIKKVQLYELKAMAGDANLNVTIHKNAVTFVNKYLTKLENLKVQRTRQTVQIEKESKEIELQVNHLEQKVEELKKLRAAYYVPDIIDYVAVKDQKHELLYGIKRMETRLQINKTALSRTYKQLRLLLSLGLREEDKDTDTVSGYSEQWD